MIKINLKCKLILLIVNLKNVINSDSTPLQSIHNSTPLPYEEQWKCMKCSSNLLNNVNYNNYSVNNSEGIVHQGL